MIQIRRRRHHSVPALNTAALPDLIFTVLFFFMIVTHMQKVAVKVKYRTPQGTELTRLTKKSAVSYIYIGRPNAGMRQAYGNDYRVQLNVAKRASDNVGWYQVAQDTQLSGFSNMRMLTIDTVLVALGKKSSATEVLASKDYGKTWALTIEELVE